MTSAEPVSRETPADFSPQLTAAQSDFSCRLPVMFLFISAAGWGAVAAVFSLIASIKFHSANFLAGPAWLTYGRVVPAANTALLYGFCLSAGLGIGLWLLTRLGRTALKAPQLVAFGALLWNVGIAAGVVGILEGDATGFQNLDFPLYAGVLLFIGYLGVAISAALTFCARRVGPLFVSYWFLFTALFWFAWIFSTAEVLLVMFPVRGVMQSVLDWWFSQNLRWVWLDLVGVALLFYFFPKLHQCDLRSRYLALFAYWSIILFASWGGIPNGAPVPEWMPVISTVGSTLSIFALVTVALNLYGTISARWNLLTQGLVPFFAFSAVAFVSAGALSIAGTLCDATATGMLRFSSWSTAVAVLQDEGFFVIGAMGAIYFIVPTLFGAELRKPMLMRTQFWLQSVGVLLIVIPLAIGGAIQAGQLASPNVPFVRIIASSLVFVRISTVGQLFLVTGHIVLLINLMVLVAQYYRAQALSAYGVLTEENPPAEVSA